MDIKKWMIIFSLIGCISSPSLCESVYAPTTQSVTSITKTDKKFNHSIATSNDAITLSSLPIGSHVWVFDKSGRNIYNKVSKRETLTIAVRSKGIFIVRIKTGNDVCTTKVLIK